MKRFCTKGCKPLNMVRTFVKALLMVGLFLIAPTAHASIANIYYANSAAGAANGMDCGDAYSYTDATNGFNVAGKWGSGSTQIGAGTTVHLCGTLAPGANTNALTTQGDGSSGNPVTIKFETGANIQSPYCPAFPGSCIVVQNNYIVIDGGIPCGWRNGASEGTCNGYIENTQNGTVLTYQLPSSAINVILCTGCEIKNLGCYNIYVHSSPSDTSLPGYDSSRCVTMTGVNSSAHDDTFHDVSSAVTYGFNSGTNNLRLEYDQLYNIDHGITIAAQGSFTATGIYVDHDYFDHYAVWDTTSDTYHHDGTHCFTNPPYPTLNGLYIYDNLFGADVGADPTAQIYLEHIPPGSSTPCWGAGGGQAFIFNNVMLASGNVNGGLLQIYGSVGSLIANNTTLGGNITTGLCDTVANGTNASFENNASQGCNTDADFGGSTTPTINFNAYAYSTLGGSSGNCLIQYPFSTCTFSLWQSTTGWDASSPVANFAGTLGTNSSGVPLSGSMLIGVGTNLTSLCTGDLVPLCSDFNGIPRPTGTTPWDIGAYQFVSALTSPAITSIFLFNGTP